MEDIEQQKKELRLFYQKRRISDSAVQRFRDNCLAAFEGIVQQQSARTYTLAGFYPFGTEPPILPILTDWLAHCGILYLPVFSQATRSYGLAEVPGLGEEWLAKGRFGIPEPRDTCRILFPPYSGTPAFWLIPGIAFSRDGIRLGRGGGWYDRLLKKADGVKIGVCYSDCLAEKLPALAHDVPVDWLLTEDGFTPASRR